VRTLADQTHRSLTFAFLAEHPRSWFRAGAIAEATKQSTVAVYKQLSDFCLNGRVCKRSSIKKRKRGREVVVEYKKAAHFAVET